MHKETKATKDNSKYKRSWWCALGFHSLGPWSTEQVIVHHWRGKHPAMV